ncbi:MAG: cell division protein FtsZ, partial [Actinobacteria bacterium]|nr:cell division protein FtsZ [Actinomycetota bacterium]
EAASLVAEAAHPDANIIFGAVIDDTLGDEVKVTVIAAGFDSGQLPYKKVDIRREPAASNRVGSGPATSTPAAPPATPDSVTAQYSVPVTNGVPRPAPVEDELDVPDFLK